MRYKFYREHKYVSFRFDELERLIAKTDFREDEEQLERLKEWWGEYGKAIILGIVIALVSVFGWRYWQQRQLDIGYQAATIYQRLLSSSAEKKSDAVIQQGKYLMEHYDGTPYAVLASLLLAKNSVDNNKLDEAKGHFQWVLDNANYPAFKQLARLRMARILLQQDKPEQAMKLVNIVDDKSYQAYVDNIKGDSYLAQTEKAKAKQA